MRNILVMTTAMGCSGGSPAGEEGEVLLPDAAQAEFVAGVDHPYFPLPVGATWAIEADGDEGFERIEVSVTPDTKVVNGVMAVVVRDTAWLDGELSEDTWDWFAQDADGNVWYLGEDTCEYEGGECVSTEGAWEWGVDGALPGIVMPAEPAVDGQPYYQEYYPGEAEDVGEVVAADVDVTVAAGSFTGCVKTRDTSTLDPELEEHKYYCPGVGTALIEEGDLREELVEYAIP